MEYGFIKGIDKPVSRLVQGMLMFTEEQTEVNFELLDAVFKLGCTAFDTAKGYGGGESERILGKWIEVRGIRDQVVILTKGGHHNADRSRVTPYDIESDLHDSLARLRTDYIDLYLLHRDDPSVSVGPILEILNKYRSTGKIKTFGCSNWTVKRIQESNAYAESQGLVPFEVSSPNFSLAEQQEEPWAGCVSISGPKGISDRDWYGLNQMPIFTWSSLAQGFLTGRITRENFEDVKEDFPESCIRSYCHESNFQRLDRAKELAEKMGLTVPQISLAYILSHPLNIFALTGCFSKEEFKSNIKVFSFKLDPEHLAWLDLKI